MAVLKNWPDEQQILSKDGVYGAARETASGLLEQHIKIITVVTADWTGPVTDYPRAAAVGNIPAWRADVNHGMNSGLAFPTHGKGSDEFIAPNFLIVETIDQDNTRVWILSNQAPPYDVQLLFVG